MTTRDREIERVGLWALGIGIAIGAVLGAWVSAITMLPRSEPMPDPEPVLSPPPAAYHIPPAAPPDSLTYLDSIADSALWEPGP